MKTELRIEGMSCQHCVGAVEGALRGLSDVEQMEVGIGYALLVTTAPLDLEKVRQVLEEEGFRLV